MVIDLSHPCTVPDCQLIPSLRYPGYGLTATNILGSPGGTSHLILNQVPIRLNSVH